MTQCSLAYTDPCSECAQYGNRSPSQAVRRLNDLEMMLQELKRMIADLNKRLTIRINPVFLDYH